MRSPIGPNVKLCMAAIMSVSLYFLGCPNLSQAEGARIIGQVTYAGKSFPGEVVEVHKDQLFCGDRQTIDTVLLHPKHQGIQHVVVSIVHPTVKMKSRPESVILYNQNCTFSPRINVARVGNFIEIHNRDDILHNTHIKLGKRTILNVAQLSQSRPIVKRLKRSGLHHIRCDKHRFMKGSLLVFNHPWYTVTEADGTFQLDGLPSGQQTIQFWHETLGLLTKDVTIPTTGTMTIDIRYPEP